MTESRDRAGEAGDQPRRASGRGQRRFQTHHARIVVAVERQPCDADQVSGELGANESLGDDLGDVQFEVERVDERWIDPAGPSLALGECDAIALQPRPPGRVSLDTA